MNEADKTGVKTTEFWIALLPTLLFIVKQFTGIEFEQGIIADGILGAVAAATSIVYIIGRVKIKVEQTKAAKK